MPVPLAYAVAFRFIDLASGMSSTRSVEVVEVAPAAVISDVFGSRLYVMTVLSADTPSQCANPSICDRIPFGFV